MPKIVFTSHLARHIDCPTQQVDATSLREALEQVFRNHPKSRGYVVDDQGSIRQHVAVFVDNQLVRQRDQLDVPLSERSEVYIMQALSGG